MNPNPFSDTITFLMQPGLTTAIFWVLLVASAAIAGATVAVAAAAGLALPATREAGRSLADIACWAARTGAAAAVVGAAALSRAARRA